VRLGPLAGGYAFGMNASAGPDQQTTELCARSGFPEPTATINIRHAITYRVQDSDGQPILIITDGVTAVALEPGLSGLTLGVVSASHRLAEAVRDFAVSITSRWQKDESAGRHRRNRRRIPPHRPGANAARV
jgi:hypothetical protein